ncbi:MAG: septum formation initiator family protein [Ferruginibacter sp.]
MKALNTVFSFFKNKYIITSLLFVLWMLFFDLKDWSLITARRDKLENLEKSEQHFNKQIAETHKELSLLKTSAATIEKYAREKYLMKKDNEDLFIVNSP